MSPPDLILHSFLAKIMADGLSKGIIIEGAPEDDTALATILNPVSHMLLISGRIIVGTHLRRKFTKDLCNRRCLCAAHIR